jgi:hypothetical protein
MENKELIITDDFIKNKIHTIRGKQVILDRDIAELYEVETKALNQAVKRNLERFPEDFMFQLFLNESKILRSQNVTSSWGGRRYSPYAFTEQGVAMLSSVINSDKAIEINIKIMRAFISMRKFLIQNLKFQQIDEKFIEYDKNFEKVFDVLQLNEPTQGIFFNGQTFDAFKFIFGLIKKAKREITLIDNYIDENTLYFFTKTCVKVKILTKNIPSKELEKYNSQYNNVEIKKFDLSHDRFLIIDEEIYLIGSSLKDAGKKWFGFFKIEDKNILNKISKNIHNS